jgi:hypothetical protein
VCSKDLSKACRCAVLQILQRFHCVCVALNNYCEYLIQGLVPLTVVLLVPSTHPGLLPPTPPAAMLAISRIECPIVSGNCMRQRNLPVEWPSHGSLITLPPMVPWLAAHQLTWCCYIPSKSTSTQCHVCNRCSTTGCAEASAGCHDASRSWHA